MILSLPAPINCKISTARSGTSWLHPPTSAWIFVWFHLVQVLYVHWQTLRHQPSNGQRTISRQASITTGFSKFFLPVMINPVPCRGRREWFVIWIYHLELRTPQSVSFSLHVNQLWVFVLIAIYWQKKLFWWGLRDALIYEYKPREQFIIMST